jgi:hypothetical protein
LKTCSDDSPSLSTAALTQSPPKAKKEKKRQKKNLNVKEVASLFSDNEKDSNSSDEEVSFKILFYCSIHYLIH